MQTNPNTGSRRRTAYSVLIGIILLTIPCYLIGFAALFILRQPDAPISAAATATPAIAQTLAPTPTFGSLPTQFVPPTASPAATSPIPTAVVATAPVIDTPSPTPTYTPSPTFTPTLEIPLASPTPIPVVTVILPDTPTPSPFPTLFVTETPTPAP